MWLVNDMYTLGRYEAGTPCRPEAVPTPMARWGRRLWVIVMAVMTMVPVCAALTMVVYNSVYPEKFTFSSSDAFYFAAGVVCYAILFLALRRLSLGVLQGSVSHRWVLAAGLLVMNLAAIYIITHTAWPITDHNKDYRWVWESACAMADGTFDARTLAMGHYMTFYNWQIPLAAFESVLIRIFGPTFVPELVTALLLMNVTSLLVYAMIRRYVEHLAAASATALYCAFSVTVLLCCNLYTHQLALPFLLVGLMMLERRDLWGWLWAGVAFGMMNLFRPMGPVVVVVVVLYALARCAIRHRRTRGLRLVTALAGGWLMVVLSTGCVFYSLGYTRTVANTAAVPYHKFLKGVVSYPISLTYMFDDMDSYNDWERQYLADNLTQRPAGVLLTYVQKTVRWAGEADIRFRDLAGMDDAAIYASPSVRHALHFAWGQYVWVALAAAWAMWHLWRRRQRGIRLDPFMMFFVIFFVVHIVIEMMTVYRAEIYPEIFLMASLFFLSGGLDHCHTTLSDKGD